MKNQLNRAVASAAAIVALAAGASMGDVVTAAVSVVGPPPAGADFGWENTIDQSGLSVGYVSNVTDFDAYVGGSPTHTRNVNNDNYAAAFTSFPANIDYTLGASTVVTQLALWNYPFADSGGIIDFDVMVAGQSDFSDGVMAGSFTAVDDAVSDVNQVQVFDLADTTGQYVRLIVRSSAFNGVGMSEIAFGTTVPAPASLCALFGFAAIRRRRR